MSEHPLGDPNVKEASPELLLKLGTSFMVTRHVVAASEVGLFEALAEGGLTLDDLAHRVGIPRRTVRISADAMVALGLLEREGDSYRNGAVAQAFLSGGQERDLRPWLRLMDLNYGVWADFTQAIRTGKAAGFITRLDPVKQRTFSQGVQAATAGAARALAATYDFGTHQRLLDLGGGTGSFLVPILARYPSLECGLFELPAVAALARENLAGRFSDERVRFFEGNLMTDPLPSGYDSFLLANVVHVFSPEQNGSLFARLQHSAAPGARLLVVDFWTDQTHTVPLFAALMAGEFLLAGGEGDVYSVDEARELLDAAGWSFLEHRPLAGPASLVVAERS